MEESADRLAHSHAIRVCPCSPPPLLCIRPFLPDCWGFLRLSFGIPRLYGRSCAEERHGDFPSQARPSPADIQGRPASRQREADLLLGSDLVVSVTLPVFRTLDAGCSQVVSAPVRS